MWKYTWNFFLWICITITQFPIFCNKESRSSILLSLPWLHVSSKNVYCLVIEKFARLLIKSPKLERSAASHTKFTPTHIKPKIKTFFFITEIKTTVVCPATEKHVKKYLHQEVFLVEESGEDYRKLTLPYISSQSFSVQVCLHFSVVPVPRVSFLYEVYNSTDFSGCTIYWRRRPRLIGLFSRIQTPILVLSCCPISSGIKSRWISVVINKRPV